MALTSLSPALLSPPDPLAPLPLLVGLSQTLSWETVLLLGWAPSPLWRLTSHRQ